MTSARFFLFLTVLFQAACGLTNGVVLPVFPGTPPVLCSLFDAPWYLCEQSENFDEEAVPNLYDRFVSFFNFREEDFAAEGETTGFVEGDGTVAVAGNGGVRRKLRKSTPPKQE